MRVYLKEVTESALMLTAHKNDAVTGHLDVSVEQVGEWMKAERLFLEAQEEIRDALKAEERKMPSLFAPAVESEGALIG